MGVTTDRSLAKDGAPYWGVPVCFRTPQLRVLGRLTDPSGRRRRVQPAGDCH